MARKRHAVPLRYCKQLMFDCKAVALCRAGRLRSAIITSAATFSLTSRLTTKSLQASALLRQAAQARRPCGARQVVAAVITLATTH